MLEVNNYFAVCRAMTMARHQKKKKYGGVAICAWPTDPTIAHSPVAVMAAGIECDCICLTLSC